MIPEGSSARVTGAVKILAGFSFVRGLCKIGLEGALGTLSCSFILILFLQSLRNQILKVDASIKRITLFDLTDLRLLLVIPAVSVVYAEFGCACGVVVVCVSSAPLRRFLVTFGVDGGCERGLRGEGVAGRRGVPEQHMEIL